MFYDGLGSVILSAIAAETRWWSIRMHIGRRRVLMMIGATTLVFGPTSCGGDSESFDFRPSARCGRDCGPGVDPEADDKARREGLDKAKN